MKWQNKMAALLACCVLGTSCAAVAAPAENLRTSVSPARVRIVVDSEEAIAYKANKNKLRLEVALTDSTATAQQAKVKDSLIKSVRLAPDGRKASKLIIDLNKDCQYKVYQLQGPHRLVVDLYRISILKQSRELAKGVNYTYLQDEMNGRQIQAHLVTVAPTAKYRLLPFSAAGAYNGRGSLAKAAAQGKALAAINASYFDTDGWVIGSIKNQGRMMAADSQPRSGLALVGDKPKIVQDIGYCGTAQLPNGKSLEIKGMNRARISDDLVLFNSFYAPTTKTNSWGREVKLVNGRVTEVSTTGNMGITSGCLILSGHGESAAALANLKVGDKVILSETLGSAASDGANTVVSGGPLLVENGRVHVRSTEEAMAADIAKGRAPRTAVGVKKDGTLLLLVVDGRSSNSVGLTLNELATYLLRLGAYDAVNYDGGGSSEMVVNGQVQNKPSDGSERRVSIGLGLFAK